MEFRVAQLLLFIKQYRKHIVVFAALLFACFLLNKSLILFLHSAPSDFPVAVRVEIREGMTHKQIGTLLEESEYIRSSTLFSWILSKKHPDRFVQAGNYSFNQPLSVTELTESMLNGSSMDESMRVTFPEGFKSRDLVMYLPENISYTTSKDLTQVEGYLFPDTYFISDSMTLDEILETMESNFETKILPFENEILASGLSTHEIITLASLIEREANDTASKHLVSGVLRNRLEIGMALQVDAVFDYLFDKESSELTEEDLTYDSPYNTYLYSGLPPAPIANPGLDSIIAALRPTPSEYYYYLTDEDGNFYYAENFEEHKQNKQKYLR